MKLHLDKNTFKYIIEEISLDKGIRPDVLEKDYYVSLLLNELSIKEKQGYAYFKGGTALYKAMKSVRRFSEDIDLTVLIDDCVSNSQAQKRLEKATLSYKSLDKSATTKNLRGSITCLYSYQPLFGKNLVDPLQRIGSVKVEATNFTVSEPTERIEIAPHLYELCDDERKIMLRENYEVLPFYINTITLERIFVDKIFASEFYYIRNEYTDVAKHVYDLTILLKNNTISDFIADDIKFNKVVSLNRKEELNRKGGIEESSKMHSFTYFSNLHKNEVFESKFNEMQKMYVFDPEDYISMEEVYVALEIIQNHLIAKNL